MIGIGSVVAATVRTTTPLLFASLGELVAERAGVINIGLEGAIIGGAFAAAVAAPAVGLVGGYVAALATGALLGLALAGLVVLLRADQIVSGTAITLLGLGLTAALNQALFGTAGTALSIPTSPPLRIPGVAGVPVIGAALFNQPVVTYVAYLLAPSLWWYLYRTHSGLGLRAVGEAPHAARAAGVSVARVRIGAIVFGSSMGGLAGAVLVLAQSGTFAEGMSAGRGFIAIAIVALGQWRPGRVVLAAVVFGLATAVQYAVQAMGWPLRYELVLMLPYVLTLFAFVFAPRTRAPAMLARSE